MKYTIAILFALIGFMIYGPIGSLIGILIWWLVKESRNINQK